MSFLVTAHATRLFSTMSKRIRGETPYAVAGGMKDRAELLVCQRSEVPLGVDLSATLLDANTSRAGLRETFHRAFFPASALSRAFCSGSVMRHGAIPCST